MLFCASALSGFAYVSKITSHLSLWRVIKRKGFRVVRLCFYPAVFSVTVHSRVQDKLRIFVMQGVK